MSGTCHNGRDWIHCCRLKSHQNLNVLKKMQTSTAVSCCGVFIHSFNPLFKAAVIIPMRLPYFYKSQRSKYVSVSCELMLPLCSSSRRPVSACAHSYGQDTSQHVHAPEDTQWQPQPQKAVHGKRMRESSQKMSRWTWMCYAVWLLTEHCPVNNNIKWRINF